MKVQGKTIVVTGGGNGIGRQVVLELLRRGARVAAVDLRKEGLDETLELSGAGDRLETYPVDITDAGAVENLPAQVMERFGSVDGLVNVAGIIQPFVRLIDLDEATIHRVMDVNFYGTLRMVRAFLPLLQARPVAHIANVSSMGAFLPVPGQTIYGASKAAVKLMTEGLYAELRDTGVGVSLVMPGAVSTEITANSGVEAPAVTGDGPSLPTTSPEDAGRMIVEGIEDDRMHIYVGRDSRILNLLTRVAPKQSTHLIQRQMKSLLD